jgi:hypothetical protein
MSKFVIRLGGTPEYGDPHYRMRVEGRQVANGNLDWSMGLPALTEEGPIFFCVGKKLQSNGTSVRGYLIEFRCVLILII